MFASFSSPKETTLISTVTSTGSPLSDIKINNNNKLSNILRGGLQKEEEELPLTTCSYQIGFRIKSVYFVLPTVPQDNMICVGFFLTDVQQRMGEYMMNDLLT